MSRETRRLLAAAALAFLALSVLARIRFPDQPPEGAVAPVLSQLTPRTGLVDLASELASVRRRIEPLIVMLGDGRVALRTAADTAATWNGNRAQTGVRHDARIDRPTGLEVVRIDPSGQAGAPAIWAPTNPSEPAFVVGAFPSHEGFAIEPVYLPTLRQTESGVWGGPLWLMPPDTMVKPGMFLFSTGAELVGLTVLDEGTHAIVPANTLLPSVRRLAANAPGTPGWLGIDVQPVSGDIGAALGAPGGMVVSWVDPASPAIRGLRAGDHIAEINGIPASLDQWRAVAGRIGAGETITLTITRGEEHSELTMVAGTPPGSNDTSSTSLGLTLRRVAAGAEVTAVAASSAAARAGLREGDVIYLAGPFESPTPAQVRATFDTATAERPLLLAYARGDTRRVLALRK